MKDYANPLLLLIIVMMMSCRAFSEAEDVTNQLDMWLLVLCVTGMLVDAALGLARALTHRAPLMSIVWAVTFLILGCCAWATRAMPQQEEQLAYRRLSENQQGPLTPDEEGESLLTRAAALGKADTVRQIIESARPGHEQLLLAALRAAESGKLSVLEELAKVGISAKAEVDGVPLLHAAAQNGCCEAMAWLLARGAEPNARDAEGSTTLIHATLYGSPAAVKLLLQNGADPNLRDSSGRSPADYARSAEISELLSSYTPPL